jgi:hypothetical protein
VTRQHPASIRQGTGAQTDLVDLGRPLLIDLFRLLLRLQPRFRRSLVGLFLLLVLRPALLDNRVVRLEADVLFCRSSTFLDKVLPQRNGARWRVVSPLRFDFGFRDGG